MSSSVLEDVSAHEICDIKYSRTRIAVLAYFDVSIDKVNCQDLMHSFCYRFPSMHILEYKLLLSVFSNPTSIRLKSMNFHIKLPNGRPFLRLTHFKRPFAVCPVLATHGLFLYL